MVGGGAVDVAVASVGGGTEVVWGAGCDVDDVAVVGGVGN